MPDQTFEQARRLVLLSAGAAALMPLSACISVLPTMTADGVGMSSNAEGQIALERRANGLSPLAADRRLEKAAIQQARYMSTSGKMEHTALRGRDFVSRMDANGIAAPAAENLAHGRFDVARVIEVWMASPPHRRNMLDGRFGKFGLGYVGGADDRRYWAMVLAA